MGAAARAVTPPPRAAAPYPPPSPGPATPASIPQAGPEAAPKKSRLWIFAGCGCLVLIAACALLLIFMPCEWYLPITSLFGYSYCP
jgi:hypothetical protein